MNRLQQSFRGKKDVCDPQASRPHQGQVDEEGVCTGKCSFPVEYLGHIEVKESRGRHSCEDAVKRLKAERKKKILRTS
uniref:PID domain-containing protein n=1 Tax=Panthera leo TaxID=9689 RepID=A0A8C8YF40_PANLE